MSKSNKLPRVSKPTKQNAFVLLSCFMLSSTIITALNAEPIQNPINTITQSSHDIEAEQALESSQATNYNENTTNSEIQNKNSDTAKQNSEPNQISKKPTSIIQKEGFRFYYTGWIESFSKIGFNNQTKDANIGKYPTDSFSAMVGSFGLVGEYDIGIQNLNFGLSITAGGLVYDSSHREYPGGEKSVMNEYIGMWEGYDLQGRSQIKRHYYVVNNAYLDYGISFGSGKGQGFYFKGGRYESKAQYMSGYTQGFELGLKTRNLHLWWFSSYGRAFAYGQWLVDFYSPRGYYEKDSAGNNVGSFKNNGIHAFKATYSIGRLDISPQVYFSIGTYTAPIIELVYDSNRDFSAKGFRSQTTLHFMNPMHNSRVVDSPNHYRYGDLVAKSTQTLYIKQRFDFNEYNFGLGLYKNFGNANAYIGTIGNPIMLDLWTTSAYDLGRNISDIISKNAITPFVFIGGKHFDNKFSWNLIGRYTDSTRSEEGSIAGAFSYAFGGGLSVGVKVEWLTDTTKAGYRVGSNGKGSINGVTGANSEESEESIKSTPKRTDDRSHSFVYVRYEF